MSTVRAVSTGLELRGKSQDLGVDCFVVWDGGKCCCKTFIQSQKQSELGDSGLYVKRYYPTTKLPDKRRFETRSKIQASCYTVDTLLFFSLSLSLPPKRDWLQQERVTHSIAAASGSCLRCERPRCKAAGPITHHLHKSFSKSNEELQLVPVRS